MIELTAPPGELLAEDVIRQTVTAVLQHQFTRQKVLVLIPDHTRTIPLPQLFRILVESLHDCQQLDFMVALGTHPPLGRRSLPAGRHHRRNGTSLPARGPASTPGFARRPHRHAAPGAADCRGALVGITPSSTTERQTSYRQIGLLNHAWDSPHAQYAHCPGGGRAGAVGYVHR